MDLPAGTSSSVTLLPGRPPVVWKQARSVRAREQEAAALRDWGPELASVQAPVLLTPEPEDDPRTLRMTLLPGRRLSELPDGLDRLDLATTLGRGLAELHALHAPHDSVPLPRAIELRLDGWLRRDSLDALGPATRRDLASALEPDALHGERRVPCHRDVSPDNVLVGPDGLGLVDWEHARADCRWVDLLRMWDGRSPSDSPWLRALAAGMGLELSSGWPALRTVGLVEGAGCVVWGAQRGDAELVGRGRALLRQLIPR
ncbi:MAG: aminoglycoside phosphotransferase family protein [Deltaproteobacteria bacterium]|nr:aminoglycoside phosphotransferase family protein [Deltaproteobacteria bacterium]